MLLAAKILPSNIDASAGSREEIERIVTYIRARWQRVRIWLRADAGFARDELRTWCEANRIDCVFGLARNDRLIRRIEPELREAKAACRESGRAERRFKDFACRTRKSWSRRRRVIGKAELLPKRSNSWFIVTPIKPSAIGGNALYEKIYCARGDMENRIKEMQLDLFADRISTATMKANQLRLWFAAFAYVLVEALRRLGLRHTQFATATAGTIRNRLLKIGAPERDPTPVQPSASAAAWCAWLGPIPIRASSRSPASGSVTRPPDLLKNAIRYMSSPRSRKRTS